MKLFNCQNCNQTVFFENMSCEKCGAWLGYLAGLETMSVVTRDDEIWVAAAAPSERWRFCENWERTACNWLVGADEGPFCAACEHNGIIPDVSDPLRLALWTKLEIAKRRLYYTLMKLDLPRPTPASGDPQPLQFDFPAAAPDEAPVTTGHDHGLITIALDEADDAHREKMRVDMREPYRTLLGHMRHEIGHYYWDKLIRDGGRLDAARAVFGDERADYTEALKRHYETGPPENWGQSFISEYASSHPWEDFAETWAHYLHIIDTLETANAFGLSLSPRQDGIPGVDRQTTSNAHENRDINALIEAWLPVVFAVNSLNRSMGQADLYPFVLSAPVIAKLDFVRELTQPSPAS